jgi:kinesin family protein 6/9
MAAARRRARRGEAQKIRIYMRLRPTPNISEFLGIDPIDNKVEFNVPASKAQEYVNNTRRSMKYKFDGVFSGEATQDEVFEHVARDAVLTALDGVNSTVFAYGQTGSGKTFTITGGVERYADRGLIPRALSLLFEEFQRRSDVMYTAHISFLEIYQEKGYDLLAANHGKVARKDLKKVVISEDAKGLLHLQNLSMHRVAREEDALNLLFLGDTHRAIAATSMNLNSSRSHCIFTINLEARTPGNDTIRRSKIHMVDLAGSERVHKSRTSGTTLDEAKAINGSLHFLEMVIVALQERTKSGSDRHVPFRNSMLTSVLRDSLGGNCRTSMVATCSAEKSNTGESISTCRFAQRVAQVENVAQVNEETDPTLMLLQKVRSALRTRNELAYRRGRPPTSRFQLLQPRLTCFACTRPPPSRPRTLRTLRYGKSSRFFAKGARRRRSSRATCFVGSKAR